MSFQYMILRDGRYRLTEDFEFATYIRGNFYSRGTVEFSKGKLSLKKGFTWDGPSGPAIDTANTLLASCVHDALYEIIDKGILYGNARLSADKIYRRLLKVNGVVWWRRMVHYIGLRLFGWTHT